MREGGGIGWGGVEVGGESADNCNGIIIKKKKRNQRSKLSVLLNK